MTPEAIGSHVCHMHTWTSWTLAEHQMQEKMGTASKINVTDTLFASWTFINKTFMVWVDL